jgi:hypothetical protein
VGHLFDFWVPIEIGGRYLVRWKALVKAYMPTYFFLDFVFFLKKRTLYNMPKSCSGFFACREIRPTGYLVVFFFLIESKFIKA